MVWTVPVFVQIGMIPKELDSIKVVSQDKA